MNAAEPDKQLFARLVTLADTMVTGFDVVDLADRLVSSCLEFLPITSAGIMLDDQRGSLRVLASSSEETRLLELLELQNNEGPCLEAFSTGLLVAEADLAGAVQRWPAFTAAAGGQSILAAYALPMQLRDRTIGALNLFCTSDEGLDADDIQVAHMMTTMATLGILNHWSVRRTEVVAEQLQTALNSRIIIEQAKGVIAERSNVDMGRAFEMLRSAARSSQRPLSEVAEDVARGRKVLGAPSPASGPPAS
jgi:transcriptional regulator with GAF, ATPase, and Fis domain